ncbi:MAG: 2-hydroxyacyl-CoA dehydratase [Sphingomonadales bacterium]|nr:MAG: 2-hydroxyacyl-CoA dehydratase [Sphingomonadales bacterium]
MGATDTLHRAYAERDEAARAWRAAGGKVIGYLEDNVPEELIIAAGFMPYRISGDPHQPTDTLTKYLYPFWKKHGLSDRQVSLGFQMSMLDLLYRGRYDFLDYLVIPFSRKGILSFCQQLSAPQKTYPELKIPEFWFLDRATTPGFDSSMFNQARIADLKAQLEKWAGGPIADQDISAAIQLTNRIRAGIARLGELRVEKRISGSDALALIGAGKLLPPADYAGLLDQAILELADAPVRDGPRIFLAGSPQDNDQLYRLIEADGATVVAENHYWGSRAAEYPVDPDMPPVIAIGDMYHKKPASVVYPLQRAIDECVARAVAARADGVVISVYAHDNLEIWPVPDTIDALAVVGIPSLYLNGQPYLIDAPDALRAQLGTFTAELEGAE